MARAPIDTGGSAWSSTTSRTVKTNSVPPALAYARRFLGQNYLSGMCQAFAVRANGAPGGSATAAIAANKAKKSGNMHTTTPPIGSTVYWTGGRTGAGHAAIVSSYKNGKPYVISTGINGKVAEVPLSYFGGSLKYQGWASEINGYRVKTSSLLAPDGQTPYLLSKDVRSEYLPSGGGGSGGSSGGGGGGGGGGAPSPSGGGGGGGGLGFSKKDFYAALGDMFGDVDTLLKLDKAARDELGEGKSIKWAIDQLWKHKITDASRARTYLQQTAWFKKYSTEITQRLVEEETRPELFKDTVAQTQASILATLNDMGVSLPESELAAVARNAYLFGWTNEQIVDAVQASGNIAFDGGSIGAETDAMREYADQFGMSLSTEDIAMLRTELMDGMGTQSAQERIMDAAAAKYAIFADRIRAGETVKSITSPYWGTASEMLEVGVDSLAWDDPLFLNGNAFMKVDPTTGQQVEKTLSEFEAEIRKDKRWLKTSNAQETIGNAQYEVLRRFGFAA